MTPDVMQVHADQRRLEDRTDDVGRGRHPDLFRFSPERNFIDPSPQPRNIYIKKNFFPSIERLSAGFALLFEGRRSRLHQSTAARRAKSAAPRSFE